MVYQKIIEGDNDPPNTLVVNKKFDWKISDLRKLDLHIETLDDLSDTTNPKHPLF